MAQATISIRTDADLKQDFERLCQDIGMNLSTAFNVFMRQAVRENQLPVKLKGDPIRGGIVTKEELLTAIEELDAGLGLRMTEEEFDAFTKEAPDGPVHREMEKRHAELEVKLQEWRAAKGLQNE